MVATNWLGKMMDLPEKFLFRPGQTGGGGGVIHGSASEANAFAVVCARERTVRILREEARTFYGESAKHAKGKFFRT